MKMNTEFESKLAALRPRVDRVLADGIFSRTTEQQPEKPVKWQFSAEISKRSIPLKTVVSLGLFAFLLGGVAMFVLLNSFCEIRPLNDDRHQAAIKDYERPMIDLAELEAFESTADVARFLAKRETKPTAVISPPMPQNTVFSLQRELLREM